MRRERLARSKWPWLFGAAGMADAHGCGGVPPELGAETRPGPVAAASSPPPGAGGAPSLGTAQAPLNDTPLALGYTLQLAEGTLELKLRRTQAATSANFSSRVLRDGRLERVSAELPNCLYTGTAEWIERRSAPLQSGAVGAVSVSTCPSGTPVGTSDGLRGLILFGSQTLAIAPIVSRTGSSGLGVEHWVVDRTRVAQLPAARASDAASVGLLERSLETPLVTEAFREGTPQETKYVQLVAVSDDSRLEAIGGASQAAQDAIEFVGQMNVVLAQSRVEPRVRVVLREHLSFASGDPYAVATSAQGEVDPEQLLNQFQQASDNLDLAPHDELMLLSGFDFTASTVGLSFVGGVCSPETSSFVIDTHDFGGNLGPVLRQFARIAAVHELGHALGMGHDGVDNACNAANFMMSAEANPVDPGVTFSDCSRSEFGALLESARYAVLGRCLDDVPPAPGAAFCGDGVVSSGEQCDCGQSDCSTIDPCCNGASCLLRDGAACSDYNDTCCSGCALVAAGTLCRATRGGCDTAEVCSGASAACPPDVTEPDGSTCTDPSGFDGACFAGDCRSAGADCDAVEALLQGGADLTEPSGGACAVDCGALRCRRVTDGACQVIQNVQASDGVPCDNGAGQCVDGDCVGDGCPGDPDKRLPGACGCGTPDTDSDGDGTADCEDACPRDRFKQAAGVCGCDSADTDTDGDGLADCLDECPRDPLKEQAERCGCGVADTDADGDQTPDCLDECPTDGQKSTPGTCGCGVVEEAGCLDDREDSLATPTPVGSSYRYSAKGGCAMMPPRETGWGTLLLSAVAVLATSSRRRGARKGSIHNRQA